MGDTINGYNPGSPLNTTDGLVDAVLGPNNPVQAPAGEGLISSSGGTARRMLAASRRARRLGTLGLYPASTPPTPPTANASSTALVLGFVVLTSTAADAQNLSQTLLAMSDADFTARLTPALTSIAASLNVTYSRVGPPTLLRSSVATQSLPYSRTFFYSALAFLRKNITTVIAVSSALIILVCCFLAWRIYVVRNRPKDYKKARAKAGRKGKTSAKVQPLLSATTATRNHRLADLETSLKAKDLGSDEGEWSSDEGGSTATGRDPKKNDTSTTAALLEGTVGTLPGSLDGGSSVDGNSTAGEEDSVSVARKQQSEGGGGGGLAGQGGVALSNPFTPTSPEGSVPLTTKLGGGVGGAALGPKLRGARRKPFSERDPRAAATHATPHGLEFDDEERVLKQTQESVDAASKLLARGAAGRLRGAGRKLVGGKMGSKGLPPLKPNGGATPSPSGRRDDDRPSTRETDSQYDSNA